MLKKKDRGYSDEEVRQEVVRLWFENQKQAIADLLEKKLRQEAEGKETDEDILTNAIKKMRQSVLETTGTERSKCFDALSTAREDIKRSPAAA